MIASKKPQRAKRKRTYPALRSTESLKERPLRGAFADGWRVLAGYTLFLAGAFVLIFMIVVWALVGNRNQHVLENFHDWELLRTLQWLQERELRPVVYEKLDPQLERSRIISQTPEPGMIVKEGRTVALVVSIGTKLEVMEDYIVNEFTVARKQLYTQLAGEYRIPRVIKLERFSSEYPEGIVIDQLPRPGENIDLEKPIVFFVSRGLVEELPELADYRLQKYSDVYDELTGYGIHVRARFAPASAASNEGLIFEQTPLPETMIIAGGTVTFTVAVRKDETLEATSDVSLERLRTFSLRVPFPVTSLTDVEVATEWKQQPQIAESSLLGEGETAPEPEQSPAEDNQTLSTAEQDEVVLRTVELVINDRAQKERRLSYPELLAGQVAVLPYRTIGAGRLAVYIDGEFYRSENFDN